jgi:anti-sigma B factor antagonist
VADHTREPVPSCIAGAAGVKCRDRAKRDDAKEREVTAREVGDAREGPVERVDARDGAVVVHLCGELDLYNADEVRDALAAVLEGRPERVVVDLGRVEFIDSTALGVLIEARKRLANQHAFLIAAPGAEPRRTLEIAGVAKLFGLYETVDAALSAST